MLKHLLVPFLFELFDKHELFSVLHGRAVQCRCFLFRLKDKNTLSLGFQTNVIPHHEALTPKTFSEPLLLFHPSWKKATLFWESTQLTVARVTYSGQPLSSGIQSPHFREHCEWIVDFLKQNVLSRNCKGQPLSTFLHLKVPSTFYAGTIKKVTICTLSELIQSTLCSPKKLEVGNKTFVLQIMLAVNFRASYFLHTSLLFENTPTALAGVLSGLSASLRTERSLVQFTCLDCGPGSQLGACKRQLIDVFLAHRCFSPSLSPSLPLSLKNK